MLVLWFEPEIYYYSDRLMAQRHLVFAPAWAGLTGEQQMTLEKIQHSRRRSRSPGGRRWKSTARASYPGVVEYVEREYQLAATVADEGEEYLILRDASDRRSAGLARSSGPVLYQKARSGPA